MGIDPQPRNSMDFEIHPLPEGRLRPKSPPRLLYDPSRGPNEIYIASPPKMSLSQKFAKKLNVEYGEGW